MQSSKATVSRTLMGWGAGALVCVLACHSEPEHSAGPNANRCAAPSLCDIRDTACQIALLDLTACVRGDEAPELPPTRVISADQFRKQLAQESADTSAGAAHSESGALNTLSLLPAGQTASASTAEVAASSVAAYYDSLTQEVTIIDDDTPRDLKAGMLELSHEFTHYLQDLSVDPLQLAARFPITLDGTEARRTLLEGEAVVTSTRALAHMTGRAVEQLPWDQLARSLTDSTLEEVRSSSTPFAVAALQLPYAIGTPYIATVWNDYDRGHVDALFDGPPGQLIDWLAGYGDGAPKPTLVEPLDCGPPEAPAGFELFELESFGVTGVMSLLAAAHSTLDLSFAALLRNDAIALYTNPQSSEVLTGWRLRFASSSAAETFGQAIAPLSLGPHLFGQEVLIAVGSRSESMAFDGDALESCPKFNGYVPRATASQTVATLLR